ncbi:MAG TPA: UDP-N-acetylmuramoyl-tripeptide--D-alanyl-D-alanine ligase [Verrucomicrobiales bacterium]|nr:UDP-N-acetylmuramoyl-tripeptide--D-alanyl-D-alanine ligase [Verrucomicrobiales bacterium]
MKELSAREAAEMAGGRLEAGAGELRVRAVSTDTRRLGPGSLYVALVGERFDGHDFLDQAAQKGAHAALVHRRDPEAWKRFGGAVIRVEDSLAGLQRLARSYRTLLDPLVTAVTGSSGKTSTKDMIAQVLAQGGVVSATRGNFNNHIGLPLSMLEMEVGTAFAVWELGMNHRGEIAALTALAQPGVGVITNIGTAHIEHLGAREAIAQEKGDLAEALPEGGWLVLNASDPFTPALRERTRARVIEGGIEQGQLQACRLEPVEGGIRFQIRGFDQECDAFLPVRGRHMVSNAILALAVGICCGVELELGAAALAGVQLAPGRLQELRHAGVLFLQDAYNANPESMKASLDVLAETPARGRRIAVLGGMGELGAGSDAAHRETGEYAASLGLDLLCSVGAEAREITARLGSGGGCAVSHADDHRAAAEWLRREAGEGDVVLLKGSRAVRMEEVLRILQEGNGGAGT